MCKERPGIRCDDHSANKLVKYYERRETLETELQNIRTVGGLDLTDEILKQRTFLENKLARLNQVIMLEEIDFNATPKGQTVLEQQIKKTTSKKTRERLETDLEVGKKRRAWQLFNGRKFRKLQKETQEAVNGDDAAESLIKTVKEAKKEKMLAEQQIREQDALLAQLEEKERLLKAKPPTSKAKKLINGIRTGIYVAKKMRGLYMLFAYDMDTFISRETNKFANKIVLGSVKKTASTLVSKKTNIKPLTLEDFIEIRELNANSKPIIDDNDLFVLQQRLNAKL